MVGMFYASSQHLAKHEKYEKLPNNLLMKGLIRPLNTIIRVWA